MYQKLQRARLCLIEIPEQVYQCADFSFLPPKFGRIPSVIEADNSVEICDSRPTKHFFISLITDNTVFETF